MRWEILSTQDEDVAIATAIKHGWLENPQRVQVKKFRSGIDISWWWIVEPYEEGCTCKDLVPRPTDLTNVG